MESMLVIAFLGEAVATFFLFVFTLFATVVFLALSAVILAFRRSTRGGILGTIGGIISFTVVSVSLDAGYGILVGFLGFLVGISIAYVRWGLADPLRLLHHPLATGGFLLVTLAGLLSACIVWLVLLDSLGGRVVLLLLAHPLAGLSIVLITLGPVVIMVLALTEYRRIKR